MRLVRSLICLFLLSIALPALAQEPPPLFTQDFPPEEFARRRARLLDDIGNDAIALVQGATMAPGYVKFRQSNEFYYLCGVEVPYAILLMNGADRRTAIYLPHRDDNRERVEGKLLSAEDGELVQKLTGIDAVFAPEDLAQHLARLARSTAVSRLFVPFSPPEGFATSRDLAMRHDADIASDPWDGRLPRHEQFLRLLRDRFPHFQVRDLSPVLDQLRLIKSEREIALIRKATRLSGLALMEAMRSTEPGIFEYELDAVAKYVFYRNGAQGDAYYSLVAAGTNAWYPHYHAGKKRMQDGEFLLMDYAPDVGYYMADVTRNWPVNGKFLPWQRELYEFYLACYRAVLREIKPNDTAQAILRRAVVRMEQTLASATFSKPAYATAAKAFVDNYRRTAASPSARLGHWVGMATHDVGAGSGPLRPGMVFTIEPALRVPEEQIYIRLEDMILITETGAEILSDFVPMDPAAIEQLMAEEGMLQRYPRDVANMSAR